VYDVKTTTDLLLFQCMFSADFCSYGHFERISTNMGFCLSFNSGKAAARQQFLPARRYASADSSYDPVSVSVCVCHKSVFYQNGLMNLAVLGVGASFHLSYAVL